jgi:hypothetical protein
MKHYSRPIVFYARLEVDAPDAASAEHQLNALFGRYYYGMTEAGTVLPGAADMNQFSFEDYQPLAVTEG